MAETQREAVPRNDAGEADTALAFLDFARHCILKKTDGLSEEQLRRPMVETGTSLLGLVWHMREGERYWFSYHLAGRGVDDFAFAMSAPQEVTAAAVMQGYRDAIAESHEILRSLPDLEQPMAIPIDDAGTCLSARWVIAHMTSETARHAGHADILRELIDGTTGR
jgi:uncharacterized damage-inducible protein DinB